MKNLLNKYVKKNKKGASMLDFFIYALVILLVGSGVFVLGGVLKSGVNKVKTNTSSINDQVEAGTGGYQSTGNNLADGN